MEQGLLFIWVCVFFLLETKQKLSHNTKLLSFMLKNLFIASDSFPIRLEFYYPTYLAYF